MPPVVGVCAVAVLTLLVTVLLAASHIVAADAFIPAPTCEPAQGETPWLDQSAGADCQAQYALEDLLNPASKNFQIVNGVPVQTPLERLEAAVATGSNLLNQGGKKASLLTIYGLTVAGGGGDGANGNTGSGLALPAALNVGASFDTAVAQRYGELMGGEWHRAGRSSMLAPVVDIDRTWHFGREDENFGEDPLLTGSMVAPEVRAIQAQGVLTTIKHFAAYTQEQGRTGTGLDLANPYNTGVNSLVSERALQEIYLPAFQAAVSPELGGAMGIMCAYSILNSHKAPPYTGADSCGNRYLLNSVLKEQFGFEGRISPDAQTAERDEPKLAFANGNNRIPLASLKEIVGDGSGDERTNPDGSRNLISKARLEDEARRILLQATKNGRYAKQGAAPGGVAEGVAHDAEAAAEIATQGAVLLKNQGALPINPGAKGTIAVIGSQAGPNTDPAVGDISKSFPEIEEGGSPWVDPTRTFTDNTTSPPTTVGYQSALGGILDAAAPSQKVTYTRGDGGLNQLPNLVANGSMSGLGSITTDHGKSQGFRVTYYGGMNPDDPAVKAKPLGTQLVPSVAYAQQNTKLAGSAEDPIPAPNWSGIANAPTTDQSALSWGVENQWQNWSAVYEGTYVPPKTGLYEFSLQEGGTAEVFINGRPLLKMVRHDFNYVNRASIELRAGRPVAITVKYSPNSAEDVWSPTSGLFFNALFGDQVELGIAVPGAEGSPDIEQAVKAAKHAKVAVVFAGRQIGEGMDLDSLALPGSQNQLIEAVAAVNPNTVVVLQGGPVAMPWLRKVSSVLEMWEPGATFGSSVSQLLFGKVSPSGHLPITFPAAEWQGPEYPGITNLQTGSKDDYAELVQSNWKEGVFVGYRWYEATHQQPLFPFGYGLSYTSFKRRIVGVTRNSDNSVTVQVSDKNTGRRAGADVVQLYVGQPPSTGEPPRQLKAFQKVQLEPGKSTVVSLTLPPSAFAHWSNGPSVGESPSTDSPTEPAGACVAEGRLHGRWTITPGLYAVYLANSATEVEDADPVVMPPSTAAQQINGVFETKPQSSPSACGKGPSGPQYHIE